MAVWTQDDLDAIERAIASGALIVRHGDKMINYRSLAEMQQARDMIARSIASPRRPRFTLITTSKGS